jgi:AcrR family transcriptional regulator
MAASETRDRILDALEQRLLQSNPATVTLEEVAAAANVSKGGLLYHFPSKDAMLAALVRRLADRAEAQLAEFRSAGSSLAHWYLQTPNENDEAELALYRSAIASMRTLDSQASELREAVAEVMRTWKEGLGAEISDPVQAEIVRLAGDGIFFSALLGLPQPDPELHRKVIERLLGASG